MKNAFMLWVAVLSFGIAYEANAYVSCCRSIALDVGKVGCEKEAGQTTNCGTGFAEGVCRFSGCTRRSEVSEVEWETIMAEESNAQEEAPTTITYYGYQGSTNKSPSGGRAISWLAQLDACFYAGHLDVADFGGSKESCYSGCDTADNNACKDSGAATCTERCYFAMPNP